MNFGRTLTSVFVAASMLVSVAGLPAGAVAQEKEAGAAAKTALTVGDAAPAIAVEAFVKGEAVPAFKPGHIYVMEFWATWCGPCIRGMPHLSEVQKKFASSVTVIGVNVWEEKDYKPETIDKVKKFVDEKGETMGYTVAYDGGARAMDKAYMKAAEKNGIPCAFVINGEGKIAYIGHPMDERFEGTIDKLVNGKFDMDAAKSAYAEEAAKERAERAVREKSAKLMREAQEAFSAGKVDDGVAKLDEAAKSDPDSAPQIELRKIRLLLDAGQQDRANGVARSMIEGSAKGNWQMLSSVARSLVSGKDGAKGDLDLAVTAAEHAVQITESKQPAALAALAQCAWAKGDKARAVEAQTKAVELAEGRTKEAYQKTLDSYKADAK